MGIMSVAKGIWTKYNWLICLVLLAYGAYKTFVPTKETITTTVVDQTTLTQLNEQRSLVTSLRTQLATAKANNITTDIEIVETTYPDGRKEKITRKRIKDTSTTTTSSLTVNASTVTVNVVSSSSTTSHSETTTQTINRKWIAGAGYYFVSQQPGLMAGYNLFRNLSIVGVGSPKDVGAFCVIRF